MSLRQRRHRGLRPCTPAGRPGLDRGVAYCGACHRGWRRRKSEETTYVQSEVRGNPGHHRPRAGRVHRRRRPSRQSPPHPSPQDRSPPHRSPRPQGDCTVAVSWNNFQQPRWAAKDKPNIQETVEAGGGTYIDADANLDTVQQLTDVETLDRAGRGRPHPARPGHRRRGTGPGDGRQCGRSGHRL